MSNLMLNPEFNLYERNGKVFCSSRQDLPCKSTNGGYVYIVDLGNRIKIGKSMDVKRRFKEIQQLSGEQIVQSCISPRCGNYHEIERDLHLRFKDQLIFGEWFDLGFEKAATALGEYSFSEPKEQSTVNSDFNNALDALFPETTPSFFQSCIDSELEANPQIVAFLAENNIRVIYCKETKEIIATDGNAIDMPFKDFLQLATAMLQGGVA